MLMGIMKEIREFFLTRQNRIFAVGVVVIFLGMMCSCGSITVKYRGVPYGNIEAVASPSQGIRREVMDESASKIGGPDLSGRINTYSDIILQVTIGFLITLYSISITIYVLSLIHIYMSWKMAAGCIRIIKMNLTIFGKMLLI